MATRQLDIDPRELRPFASRPKAEGWKLERQISQYGSSSNGMPPIEVYESLDGYFVIYNGITRATRMAMLAPGVNVRIEVLGRLAKRYADSPSVGDTLP